ncbi:hypothetical protein [Nostoc sp. PA-18-2419]|uniref:hypothetical protein n=1 Tax=Nostoc sp. PA-18-2419 TaxID=2575443 RepID=UPI0016746EAD|nr:hypothetical protein [Nostoc sp. PA-18-2419]
MKIITNAFDKGIIVPALLTILVCGALGLAITDPASRPAYFDLVRAVIVAYFWKN